MADPLLKTVKDFLSRHLLHAQPLLLGYSGGPDSKALLYLLLKCRDDFNFELHLAHIDHGWRAESQMQAELLRKEAENLKLPFHLQTLDPELFKKGNLEEKARNLRIQFFQKLYMRNACQALFLAHQADDHAEIVLKRVCEGAHLSRLSGFSDKSILQGMQIWRPLISVRKKQIIDWLEQRSLSFFTDPTNLNPQFLRGRMRKQLLPLLNQGFGKEIIDNFCYLGKTAGELREYFLQKLSSHLQKISTGILGSYLEVGSLEEIELQFLLKEWFAKENVIASREVIQAIIHTVLSNTAARFHVKRGWIFVDQKRIFLLKSPIAPLRNICHIPRSSIDNEPYSWKAEIKESGHISLHFGFHSSKWVDRADLSAMEIFKEALPWKNAWHGMAWALVPAGESFEIVPPALAVNYHGMKELKEKRKQMQIPSFLCDYIPLICHNNEIIYDFLTGSNKLNYNYKKLNIIYIKLGLSN